MQGKYSRRRFLGQSARALIAAGSVTALPNAVQAKIQEENQAQVLGKGFSVLQGLTDESSTQLSVDVPKDFSVHYRLLNADTGQVVQPHSVSRASRDFSSWAVDQIGFDGLSLGSLYLFQVLDDKADVLDERELHTVDLENREARIATMSCMMDFNIFKSKIWSNLEKVEPDYCFFLGDNVYGDLGGFSVGPKLLWRRYIETRKNIPFYHKRKLIPVLALWDDHDYGKNNANHKYKHKNDALDVFNSFFPRQPIRGVYETGPGVSSVFSAFHHDFFFIDNRFYRDTRRGDSKSFWGLDQFTWVQRRMEQSERPKWLMQGSQFFGAYQGKSQSYESGQYEEEFDAVMAMLEKTNQPSIFVSGDVHFTEVQNIEKDKTGYNTFEITASHMHSFTSKPKSNKRRRQEVADANFVVIDIHKAGFGALYETRSIGRDEFVGFHDFLQVY